MTLDEAMQEPGPVKVEVFNPETPFGGVQVLGAEDQPIQIEINTGSPISSVFGRVGDIQPLCTDYDECYILRTGTDLPDSGATDRGIERLVAGQNYVDVTFLTSQPNTEWHLVECAIVNTTDASVLNIWPGIITGKSTAGLRILLNGMPDSSNYFLHWAIAGFIPEPFPATFYRLSGPPTSTGGDVTFTVSLPPGGTVDVPIVVTPDDSGGGGSFLPGTVVLSTTNHTRTFVYTPGSYGMKSISTTSDSILTDPAPVAHEVIPGTYIFSGPTSGLPGVASTDFTVSGAVVGTMTVTPDDGVGGIFTPTSVTLTTAAPSATFTYIPAPPVATTYSLSGPSSGAYGVTSTNFTVALSSGETVTGTMVVTPSAGAGGGSFTPTTVNLTTAAPTATFTYTPVSSGLKTISTTNDHGLTNPTSIGYTVGAPFDPLSIAGCKVWLKADGLALADNAAVTYWNDLSLNANDVGGTATYKTNIVNGKAVVRFNGTSDKMVLLPSDTFISQPDTVFAVAKSTGTTTTGWYWMGDGAGHIMALQPPGNFIIYAGSSIADTADWRNAFHVFAGVFNGASSAGYVDGTSVGTPGAIGAGTVGRLALMTNDPYTPTTWSPGDYAELLIYNSALSSTDRTNVTNYLKGKYGIP